MIGHVADLSVDNSRRILLFLLFPLTKRDVLLTVVCCLFPSFFFKSRAFRFNFFLCVLITPSPSPHINYYYLFISLNYAGYIVKPKGGQNT